MPKGFRKDGTKLGFQRGHHINKGRPSPNKGRKNLFKHSKATKLKMSKMRMGNKYNFQGGIAKSSKGYILIRVYNHPFSSKRGYIMEHRLIMEKYLKRYLCPEEVVHHKGIKFPLGSIENKQDNRIENLQLFSSEIKHRKFHRSILIH